MKQEPEPDDDDQEYEFVLKYELCVGESHLFSYLSGRGINVLDYFIDNPGQIKIDQFAQVEMNYIETIRQHKALKKEDQKLQCRLVGAIFKQDEYMDPYTKNVSKLNTSICDGYNQQFDFPYDT